MYCPSCGTELAQAMSYCNRCGASLKALAERPEAQPPARLVGAAWAISVAVATIALGGFALIFAIIMALVSRGVSISEGGMVLIFFTLLVILTICWLLIRQLARIIGKSQPAAEEADGPKKKALAEKPAPRLEAPRAPLASVTDHTTRTFEPVYRERETKQ